MSLRSPPRALVSKHLARLFFVVKRGKTSLKQNSLFFWPQLFSYQSKVII